MFYFLNYTYCDLIMWRLRSFSKNWQFSSQAWNSLVFFLWYSSAWSTNFLLMFILVIVTLRCSCHESGISPEGRLFPEFLFRLLSATDKVSFAVLYKLFARWYSWTALWASFCNLKLIFFIKFFWFSLWTYTVRIKKLYFFGKLQSLVVRLRLGYAWAELFL